MLTFMVILTLFIFVLVVGDFIIGKLFPNWSKKPVPWEELEWDDEP